MPSRRPVRKDDARLKENLPPAKRARVTPVREKTRYQKLVDGDITVEDLDDDEIIQGRTKDKNGNFAGRPPKSFPRALHDALRMEFKRRIEQKFQQGADIGYAVLVDVALDRRAAAPARVSAAMALMDRGIGKVPDKVFAQVEVKKYEEDIESLLVDIKAGDDNVYDISTKEKTA